MSVYAFVDSIDASPTVLLDLDDQAPLSVIEGVKTAPPTRRVSSYGSSARDGDVLAQDSYNDRTITIPLSFKQLSSAEDQVATIQALGRLLDGPQWLMWQHEGMTVPVFYRTRYGDTDIDDSIMDAKPQRDVTLTIVAEPFAYGLPESGTATIANDPTAATNPMSYVFPAVKGDVATPLVLSIPASAGSSQPVFVSTATPSAIGAPFYADTASTGLSPGQTGWTLSDVTDSAWIGGSKRRGVKTTGSNVQDVIDSQLIAVPVGDYRVFARGHATVDTSVIFNYPDENPPIPTGLIPGGGPTATWFDFGIARLPTDAPQTADPFGLAPSDFTTSVSASFDMVASAGTVDLDGLLFIPVGLDAAGCSKFIRTYIFSSGAATLTIDGVNEAARLVSTSGPPFQTLAGTAPAVDGAGFPEVVPGYSNQLALIRNTYTPFGGGGNDSKTATTVVTWKYYPRYLYVRPATT